MATPEQEAALDAAIHEFCKAARDTAVMLNQMTLVLENLRRITDALLSDVRADG